MKPRIIATASMFAVLVFAATAPVLAGEVFGKIVEGSASVAEAATVTAKCGAKAYPSVKTDKAGSYHLALGETGKCTLTLAYKNQTASLEVASYDDPAQVDIVLEVKDGKLAARRR